MSNSSNGNRWIFLVLGAILAAFAIVWKFSTFFGLDISTGGKVFGYLIILIIAAGVA